MNQIFLTILNMSLTGAFVILVVWLARLALKKAPKIISYALWAVAGFRLLIPFSIESVLSLIPFKNAPIPPNIDMQPVPAIDTGIPAIDQAIGNILPAATPQASINPLQIWTTIFSCVWLAGCMIMLIYGVVSYFRFKRRIRGAAHSSGNIYLAENIKTPFVLGFFRPKILIPPGLSPQEREYVTLHEQTHIRRRDHITKFVAYLTLCLHWFNPFAWVAFLLMGVDMEMSCDERVLKEKGLEIKKSYSLSLLSLAEGRRTIGASPLAFGEGGVKERVKNVLNLKKRSRTIIMIAVVLVVALGAGLMINKVSAGSPETPTDGDTLPPNTERITTTEAVPFETTVIRAPEMPDSYVLVVKDGVEGMREIIKEIEYDNSGQVISETIISSKIVVEPINGEVLVGTGDSGDVDFKAALLWPVGSGFEYVSRGWREWQNHLGMDFVCETDSPIYAAGGGRVIISEGGGSLGNYLVIDHGNGMYTLYAHNNTRLCEVGDIVKRGDVIALAGSTGNSNGPHLHFEVLTGATYETAVKVDPAPLIGYAGPV